MLKRLATLGGIAATLVLVGAGCVSNEVAPSTPYSPPATETPATNTTPSASPPATKATAPASKTAPTLSATEQYQRSLNTYRTVGAYYQFVGCHANPATISIKRGVSYMIDNRDKIARTVKVGPTIYHLGGYGYVIAKAPAPGRYFITCDGGGTGLLNVEG